MGLIRTEDLQIRDPFVVPVPEERKYYLFGSTDRNIWETGVGFDVYVGDDLERWEGPYPAFRPEPGFYAEKNFWAPEVYRVGDLYYMFATFRRKSNGLLGTAVLVADRLSGPFRPHSDGPVTPESWSCLDGTLFFDHDGAPWMVFCHEWTQVGDGEICAIRLSPDFKRTVGEPVTLFRASEAPWTTPYVWAKDPSRTIYVTDGPFLIRLSDGGLVMLWSSFVRNVYALGVARSASGKLEGPWMHDPEPLFRDDGGHGMVFRAFDGGLRLALHAPNRTPNERARFLPVREAGGTLVVVTGGQSNG